MKKPLYEIVRDSMLNSFIVWITSLFFGSSIYYTWIKWDVWNFIECLWFSAGLLIWAALLSSPALLFYTFFAFLIDLNFTGIKRKILMSVLVWVLTFATLSVILKEFSSTVVFFTITYAVPGTLAIFLFIRKVR